MASVEKLRPIPPPFTNILPSTQESTVRVIAGPDMLRGRYETLSRLSKSLTLDTPEEWVEVLTSELLPVLNFDFLDVVIFNKDGDEVVWSLRANQRENDSRLPIQESLFWCVYDHQKPLWIEDSDADQGCAAVRRLRQLRSEYRSFYGLPLSTPRGCLGSLGVASSQPNSFTPDDVEFLAQVANQLSLAIENWLAHRAIADLQNKLAEGSVSDEDELIEATNFNGIVGKSSALRKVLKQIETVAPTNSNVLIFGETGTGKELVARAIHHLSARRSNAFVRVNCAAIPTGLLESELFGHERGAFTGAIMRKAGRFEVADKGTLFLDEVGDIPLELQPKLLRVLQEREFERLGSTRTQQVDVRVVAATHRDLKQMVQDGEFRSDLYYRLHVFPLSVPPLRERREDIPLLVRHFVDEYARRMNRCIETIPAQAMEALRSYSWPGNVRELQNFIERTVILSPGCVLRPPLAELKQAAVQTPSSELSTLEEMEREHVLRALKESNWVTGGPKGAAVRLGMKRTTLAYRIRKLNIPLRPD
jgi:formate hydrogenlyase transcriptional activator